MLPMSAFLDAGTMSSEHMLTCPDDVLRVLTDRLYMHYHTASSRPIHAHGKTMSDSQRYSF